MSISRAVPISARRTMVCLVSVAVLTGCMTGERPSFSSAVSSGSTGDVAVDEVIGLLTDPPDTSPVTADYTALRKLGIVTTAASVARGRRRSAVTIGDVRYLDEGGTTSTCDLTTGDCTAGTDESRISDTSLTSSFATVSPVARLRQDVRSALAPATRSEREIGGEPSTCVQIEVTGGTTLYCVSDTGLLTLQDTADLRIELTSLSDGVEDTSFTTTR